MKLLQLKTVGGVGGAETLLHELTKRIINNNNHIHTIIGSNGDLTRKFEESKLPYDIVNIKNPINIISIIKILNICRDLKIDLLVCHGNRTALYGLACRLVLNIPYIIVEHNIDLWRNSTILNYIDKLLSILAYKKVAVSEAVAKMLINNKIKSTNNIKIIKNGCSKAPSLEKDDQISIKIKSSQSIKIVNIARLVNQKGQKYLIESIEKIIKKGLTVKLYIFGDGDQKENLVNLIHDKNLEGHVYLLGNVPNANKYLELFDIFVLSSITEGLPIALLEAMSASLPVIATETSGIPEVIRNNVNGLLAKPADSESLEACLEKLIKDSQLRNRLSINAYHDWSEKYDIEKVASQYEILYKECCNKAPQFNS